MPLVAPHGGKGLKPLALTGAALAAEVARARTLPQVKISSRERGDLVMMGIGGFTPLDGFMSRADWEAVCQDYRTASGLFWPIPITLSSQTSFPVGKEIALTDEEGPVATMKVTEAYRIDKAKECQSIFRTTDAAHPGVAMVMAQPEWNLAGAVQDIELMRAIGADLANSRRWPEWKAGSEFKAVRDRSAAARR